MRLRALPPYLCLSLQRFYFKPEVGQGCLQFTSRNGDFKLGRAPPFLCLSLQRFYFKPEVRNRLRRQHGITTPLPVK